MQKENNCEGCCGDHRCVKKVIAIVGIVLTIFLIVKIVKDIKAYGYIGKDSIQQSLITVNGKGEKVVIPDMAKISFSVIADKLTVAEAQTKVSGMTELVTDFLKQSEIDSKDVKTTYYNISPRYDYVNAGLNYYGGKRVLAGYEVTQGFEVKIRKVEDSAKILGGLGKIGVQNISGLTFMVDKEDELKAEARSVAIADARTQAEKLAKDLGVRLVRITNFSEGGNYPIYYAKSAVMGMGGADSAVPAPEVPAGENTITSNVTITYEIR